MPLFRGTAMKRKIIHATTLAALAFATAGTAAAITCNGNFQVLPNGSEIATPYCEDNELARVAMRHGMCVRPWEIRHHPTLKAEACGFVGDDIRVRDTCIPYQHGDGTQDATP
jgi:hypothetical protein